MKLTNDHIDYIIKDLHYRGIVVDGIEDELIDHICSAVEVEIENGQKFIEAYHEVLKKFGHTGGLREVQKHSLRFENRKTKIMIRNYLIIAWRNLRKQGFYSFTNIFGLAIGVAACLVIVLFIVDELSYDAYNTKADRIFRVNEEIKFGGNHMVLCVSGAPTANAMLQDYPEIESTVRFRSYGTYLVKTAEGTQNIKEQNLIWTDSTFFNVFSVNVLEGNPKTALKDPASIAISKSTAQKYFPGKSALGETLILDNKYNAKVTAVYEDIPTASHFHFDLMVAQVGDWPVAKEAQSNAFLNENFNTYLLLKQGADAKVLEKMLPVFLKKYIGPQIASALGNDMTMEKFLSTGNKWEITLTPLRDIHLHSDRRGELEANGNITYIYLFGIIAAFILTIACINFMNLSTARSSNRAKEVGVRKVMGSLRSHLVRQFLTESILVTFFSFAVAIWLSYMFLPMFNNLSLKHLQLPFTNVTFYLVLVVCVLVIGLMAGLYPSFFLSAFKPVNVLKGQVSLGMKSGIIRSGLVVFQFVISISLIIAAITVNKQLNFIQNKKLGFEKNQVIIVHDPYALGKYSKIQTFKNEVLKISSISKGTISGFLPVNSDRNNSTYWKDGRQPTPDNLVSLQTWSVDRDYIETMGMKISTGRGFSAEFPADSTAVILNEAAIPMFSLGENPIGQKVTTFDWGHIRPDGSPDPEKTKSWTIVGIIENFHFSTMKEGITPLGLFLNKSSGNVSFKFHSGKTEQVIQSIERMWKQMAPGQPFHYSFLDEDFLKMYASEQRLSQIFFVFAGLAIVIACLGLFALTAFTAEQRTKEIGIRKVLGASVSSIVGLLSMEFGKLILIAFVIAAPLAWFGVDWWLKSYTYKTEIGVMVYLLAGAIALAIAWLTMGYQSIRAASSDPVRSLRNE